MFKSPNCGQCPREGRMAESLLPSGRTTDKDVRNVRLERGRICHCLSTSSSSNSAPSYSSPTRAVKGRRDDCSGSKKGEGRGEEKGTRGGRESIVTISPSNNRTVCRPLAKLWLVENTGGGGPARRRAAGWVVYYTHGRVGGATVGLGAKQHRLILGISFGILQSPFSSSFRSAARGPTKYSILNCITHGAAASLARQCLSSNS